MSTFLSSRLQLEGYEKAECSAAIRGERIPMNLGLETTRLSVIRGIRYHMGFGTELRNLPNHPEFTRALNARSIMSNIIPDINTLEEFPYCIWHPDLATETTYHELAKRYRILRYDIARACAVAGYYDLYRELQLLPEISIAEEARDNKKNIGSQAILKRLWRSRPNMQS